MAARMRILKDMLPPMTEDQARALARRILETHRFEPSIADVLAHWRDMERRRRQQEGAIYLDETPPRISHAERKRRAGELRRVRTALGQRRSVPGLVVSESLTAFARSFFPHMSEELIERNKMEIANCRADREREDRCGSPYVTMMELDETGCVTLYMAKRPREEDAHAEDPALFEVCR